MWDGELLLISCSICVLRSRVAVCTVGIGILPWNLGRELVERAYELCVRAVEGRGEDGDTLPKVFG